MGQSAIYAAASAPAGPIVSVPVADACCDLLELFAGVADGRVGPGRDHPVAAVLALAAAAVVAGMKGYTAITGWVADVPPAILADLYLRSGAAAAPPRLGAVTVPIFPLPGAILFPRAQLPLHIFEPRYREMVRDAIDGSGRIGMIQPSRLDDEERDQDQHPCKARPAAERQDR